LDGLYLQRTVAVTAQLLTATHFIWHSWGFFSGATRQSATYVLETRLGLQSPVLIAMEDAPGKPDPTGLLAAVMQLEQQVDTSTPIIYVGDTVADMYTVQRARALFLPSLDWCRNFAPCAGSIGTS
jgi:phosphoglycolate phosphatase-like HAD superfamily hydrolase